MDVAARVQQDTQEGLAVAMTCVPSQLQDDATAATADVIQDATADGTDATWNEQEWAEQEWAPPAASTDAAWSSNASWYDDTWSQQNAWYDDTLGN